MMENGKILLVVAHPKEYKEVKKELSFQESPLELFQSGMGKIAGPSLKSFLLSQNGWPKLIINLGLAGALQQNLEIGDLILVKEVEKVEEEKESLKLSSWFLERVINFFKERGYPCHLGTLLTLEEPLLNSQKRNFLGKSGALAVDMEAYFLAAVAFEFKIPFLSLKVISDYADEQAEAMVKKQWK